MPWRPSFDAAPRRDDRLDPYRERAANLTSEIPDFCGTLFVRVQAQAEQIGGALWWRRFTDPIEVAWAYLLFADAWDDDWEIWGAEELDRVLADWSENKVLYLGNVIQVEWLDDAQSRHVRDLVFGFDAPDA